MKHTRKRFVITAIAAFAAATSGIVIADSDDHEDEKESSERYEMKSSDHDAQRSLARWEVTKVTVDENGGLSMLQHVVPMKDMAAFGSVTNGIIANGLKIDRVDAVFNEYDAEVREPHYHFTQRFLAAK